MSKIIKYIICGIIFAGLLIAAVFLGIKIPNWQEILKKAKLIKEEARDAEQKKVDNMSDSDVWNTIDPKLQSRLYSIKQSANNKVRNSLNNKG